MSSYNIKEAESVVLEFCRFPIPRTPSQISLFLKKKLTTFFPRTPTPRTVGPLREKILNPLVKKGFILRYNPQDPSWMKARRLVTHYYSRSPQASPRKLSELYQTNFLCLVETPWLYKVPSFAELNPDLVALLFNFTQSKKQKNYTWKLLNLFHSYNQDEYRDKIRIRIHHLNFSEKEKDLLEKMLDYSPELKYFFDDFPFNPSLPKALEFLEEL